MKPINYLPLLLGLVVASLWAAEAPMPAEFAWRAKLSVPAGASAARVTLPADAMMRLQSSAAHDVRVFNADGETVAFTVVTPAGSSAERAQTRRYPAYPLFSAVSDKQLNNGAVQVYVDQANAQGSVWVRFGETNGAKDADGAADSATKRLSSVLFDTREEKQAITALTLQADFPPNALMQFSLASSTDLARWNPVALKGPLFRFAGAGAPSNQTLELQQSMPLEKHYLRLSWDPQAAVRVDAFTGIAAPSTSTIMPARVSAPLNAGLVDGNTSITWALDFAAPIASLQLTTSRTNTLVPIRIMGRNDAAQSWRQLGQGVVYRLGAIGQANTNPPISMGGNSVRSIRVEAMNGMTLPVAELKASLEFDPIQLVFLASGKAPFELVVGRSKTSAAAVDPSMLRSIVTTSLEDLPSAAIVESRVKISNAANPAIQRLLPAGMEQRSVMLWGVLLVGVLVLGGVAYSLLRQLSASKSVICPSMDDGGK